MEFEKTLSGMITAEFTSASPEKILSSITQEDIPLSHVLQKGELTYQITLHHRNYKELLQIISKCGNKITVIKKSGYYWDIQALLRRPVLTGMLLFLLIMSLYLPSRIFFVTVSGNTNVPTQRILAEAENCGISFGASRKLVRSEKVKNELLSAVPQLQWAGINTSGCTAVISVKERTENSHSETSSVSNVIADRDGYILSATVTSGTAHFLPGDAVAAGQLLISGYVDCGICIRATRAAGEIIAQTKRKIAAVTPETYILTEASQRPLYKISLIIGKKRINLWKDSRISEGVCGRMYREYFVSLPGGFQLPFAIAVDSYFNYRLQEEKITEINALWKLKQFSEDYLIRQMVSGRILAASQKLSCHNGQYRLECSYICTEMIGKEQIGVINGKRN